MPDAERLRSFLAVYRAGSVTGAAAHRGVSQPAVSQHLAALEASVGARLFTRGAGGVEPTQRGRELYAAVAGPLDALEEVLDELAVGRGAGSPPAPVRVGSSPEYFAAQVLHRLTDVDLAVTATFAPDPELFTLLERGEVDVAVTSTTPPRRTARASPVGATRFVLVAAPGVAPVRPIGSLDELAGWLTGRAWASYSLELPITRRFWQTALGRPFAARLRLVAPDLRAVVHAVELGLGVSLLPDYVCARPLAAGRVVELYPVGDLVPEEPRFVSTRAGEEARPQVRALVDLLAAPGPPPAPAA
ncbi:MAG: LysR family transcriptional regulator [Actinomycetota bacterium]|jgi:DNA-binding transcriptional LysR family regulator|nr:LysR family transcriptional regulator [Actinomycetota bacterium]